jgi:hypothetical protein
MHAQTLGISHSYVSLTWICGPIAGFVVRTCIFLLVYYSIISEILSLFVFG